jgi:hypothetical protein
VEWQFQTPNPLQLLGFMAAVFGTGKPHTRRQSTHGESPVSMRKPLIFPLFSPNSRYFPNS